MVTYNILLNIKQGYPVDTGIEVTQGDYGQVQFLIRVKDDDAYILNPKKVAVVFNLSNGYIINGEAEINAGTFKYILKGNELQSPGKVSAVVTLEYSDGRVSSCGFLFNCRFNSLYNKNIPAGNYFSELEQIVEQGQKQIDYLNELINILQGSIGETALVKSDLSTSINESQAGIYAADAVAIGNIYRKITNVDTNNPDKIPTSALIHRIWEKMGMGEELNVGSSIVGGLNQLNSDLELCMTQTAFEAETLWSGRKNSGDIVNVSSHLMLGIATSDANNSSSSRSFICLPILNNGSPYFIPALYNGNWMRLRVSISEAGMLSIIESDGPYIIAVYGYGRK